MAWQPGDKLNKNKYKIEQELGQGWFGITYLARDRQGNSLVIKTLKDDVLASQITDEERNHLESKFLNEAMKLAQCHHPHIVKVIEPFKEGKIWCIAMEYIPGYNLEYRPQRVLCLNDALRYIQEIGEALIVVHSHRLQHLDVKPENIMVREGTGEAVLIDFGLARGIKDKFTTINTEIPITVDGFAPLELYYPNAERGDFTDIYSLAATLYVLLTGEVPASAIDRQFGNARLVPPQEINPQIPNRTNRAIIAGMKIESNNRPQSVRAWMELLGESETLLLRNQIVEINNSIISGKIFLQLISKLSLVEISNGILLLIAKILLDLSAKSIWQKGNRIIALTAGGVFVGGTIAQIPGAIIGGVIAIIFGLFSTKKVSKPY